MDFIKIYPVPYALILNIGPKLIWVTVPVGHSFLPKTRFRKIYISKKTGLGKYFEFQKL